MDSSSRPSAVLEPEVAANSAELICKAFILHFIFLGVDAIDASKERKLEMLDAYAIAAHEFLLVKYGVWIETLVIRGYYTKVRCCAEKATPHKWDAFLVGRIIAQLLREKEVFDAVTTCKSVSLGAFHFLLPFAEPLTKEGNVSEDT